MHEMSRCVRTQPLMKQVPDTIQGAAESLDKFGKELARRRKADVATHHTYAKPQQLFERQKQSTDINGYQTTHKTMP